MPRVAVTRKVTAVERRIGRLVGMTSMQRVLTWLAVLTMSLVAGTGLASPAGADTSAHASHAGWHGRSFGHKELNGIACPSVHLCVGIEQTTVEVTTNITSKHPTWTNRTLENTTSP